MSLHHKTDNELYTKLDKVLGNSGRKLSERGRSNLDELLGVRPKKPIDISSSVKMYSMSMPNFIKKIGKFFSNMFSKLDNAIFNRSSRKMNTTFHRRKKVDGDWT